MAYVISEACIDVKSGSCMDVCPVDCIFDVGRMLVIHPGECIDCGACEPECPVEAIHPEGTLPDELQRFIPINNAIATGAEAVREAVEAYAEAHVLPPIAGYRG
jgi:ferredoxin